MLLWKHRDSGHPHNFVDKVAGTDSTMAYVALFNAGDTARAEAWVGFNEAGFAVMNTASYNLAPDTAVVKDREGLVMSEALSRCRSVADFIGLIDVACVHGPAGIQANFGVIDAMGNGAYVEASDHSYAIFPLSDAEKGCMVRSNYSYSGGDEKRLGAVRHDNAVALLAPWLEARNVTPETFTEVLSRSFYHDGERKDLALDDKRWIADEGECIPRRSSCASVVIEGVKPGEYAARTMVMWVAIGFPTASHVEAVTLDSIPSVLLPIAPGLHSPLCDEVNQRRSKTFTRRKRGGKWLFDMAYLRRVMAEQRQLSAAKYREGRKRRNE